MIEVLFWITLFLVIYSYIGYLGLLWLLGRVGRRPGGKDDGYQPSVSLIIIAYNEEKSIKETLEKLLELDYPSERLQILVASDGSTDGTNAAVREFGERGVELVPCPRVGKEEAKARAVKKARGEILVFTDGTSLWSRKTLRKLVRNFADPEVGCISGRTAYFGDTRNSIVSGQGTYWDYEVFTKRLEGALGGLVVVCGPIHAVRRELYEPLPSVGSADMMVPLRVQELGYRAIYEEEAVVREQSRLSPEEEVQSRIRLSVRAFWILRLSPRFLNPFYKPRITFFLISHKVLRWLGPEILLGLLFLNVFLLDKPVYLVFMGLQFMFYGAGIIGHASAKSGRRIFAKAHFFCLINYCALVGLVKFLKGDRAATWETLR